MDLGFDAFDGPLAIIAALAAVVLLFLVIWPIVLIARAPALLVLLFLVSLAGRLLFRRPWTVVARGETPGASREHEWRVVGWRPSSRLIDAAAKALRRRDGPPGRRGAGGSGGKHEIAACFPPDPPSRCGSARADRQPRLDRRRVPARVAGDEYARTGRVARAAAARRCSSRPLP